MERITLTTNTSESYALIDSGVGEKLERYGNVVLARPDPQALWPKNLPEWEWAKAQARFERKKGEVEWITKESLPKEWPIEFGGLHFLIRPTSFKHTGLFPEQLSNWEWLSKIVKSGLALNAGEET